jgi:hypothetical protein
MMTDEQLIADLDAADAASLGCADIIVQRDRAASSVPLMPNARFAQIFDLHPGCAVAAIDTDGGEPLVGLPNGGTMRFVHGPGGSDTVSSSACLGIRQACGELDMSTAVVCGSLVHVWMASGRQVGALDRMTIGMAVAGGPDCSWFSCRFDHVR